MKESNIKINEKDLKKASNTEEEYKNKPDDKFIGNIFEDFVDDNEIKKDIVDFDNDKQMDVFYYINKATSIVFYFLGASMFGLLVLYTYIYIQNNEDINNSQILDPVCFMLNNKIDNIGDDQYCSSISYLNSKYNNELQTLKLDYKDRIFSMIQSIYEVDNYMQTKQLLFIKDKSKNRLNVIELLSKFDDLKKDFYPNKKSKIKCDNLQIDNEIHVLSMNCEAYSGGYEKQIRGFQGNFTNTVNGTSLSIANSFINYIKLKSDFFTIVNEQEMFQLTDVVSDRTGYTNKTSFKLELLYK